MISNGSRKFKNIVKLIGNFSQLVKKYFQLKTHGLTGVFSYESYKILQYSRKNDRIKIDLS